MRQYLVQVHKGNSFGTFHAKTDSDAVAEMLEILSRQGCGQHDKPGRWKMDEVELAKKVKQKIRRLEVKQNGELLATLIRCV
jgi:hypothetical protein